MDPLGLANILVEDGLKLKMLFDQTSEQGGQLRLLAHDIHRALEKLRNIIRDHQDHVNASRLKDLLYELQRDILLTTAKCAKPRPLKIFATSEQHKELKRLQAKVADLTLILNDDIHHDSQPSLSDSNVSLATSSDIHSPSPGRSPSNKQGAEVHKLQPSTSEGVAIVQPAPATIPVQNDVENGMSSRDSREGLGSESWAVSGFSSPNLHSKEIEDLPSRGPHSRSVAASITNVAYQFSLLSQNDEALPLYREAVDIRRQLASQGDEDSFYELTESLHQLAHHLRLMNRDEEGIVFDTEVVDIRRELVARNPDKFLVSLAKGVHMLGHIYNCVQRPLEGLPFIKEEVEIYRKLFTERPSYRADLAQALHGLAHQLRLVGRQEEGMTPDLEALAVLRGLGNPH